MASDLYFSVLKSNVGIKHANEHQISIWLDDEYIRVLRSHANDFDMSVSDVVSQIVRHALYEEVYLPLPNILEDNKNLRLLCCLQSKTFRDKYFKAINDGLMSCRRLRYVRKWNRFCRWGIRQKHKRSDSWWLLN